MGARTRAGRRGRALVLAGCVWMTVAASAVWSPPPASGAGGTGSVVALDLIDAPGDIPTSSGAASGGFRVVAHNGTGADATNVVVRLHGPIDLGVRVDNPVIDAPAPWSCTDESPTTQALVCRMPFLAKGATSPPIAYASHLISVWGEPSHISPWAASITSDQGITTDALHTASWRLRAPRPANDDFGAATPLTGASGTLATSTWGTTVDPAHGPGEGGAGSAWYAWTPPCSGTATVTATNGFGGTDVWAAPYLQVFSGSTAPELVELGSSYNGFSPSQVVQTPVVAGTPIRVALGSLGHPTVISDQLNYTDFVGREDLDLQWALSCDPGPTVTSVSPSSGSTDGGTTVTVTGSGFVDGSTTVTIGSSPATSVQVLDANTLTAVTPPAAAGTVAVTVTTPAGSGSLPAGFEYRSPLSVSSITPASGSTNGGNTVLIAGNGFQPGSTVSFGATTVAATLIDSSSLTAVVPAGIAGIVTVTVHDPDGTSADAPGGYQYVTPPIVAPRIVSINQNPTGGGGRYVPGESLTAVHLSDADGHAVANRVILLTESGANHASGSSRTDTNGDARFLLPATAAGQDAFTACFDADESGTCDPGELTSGPSTITWFVQVADPEIVSVEQNPGRSDLNAPGSSFTRVRLLDTTGNPVDHEQILLTATGANPDVQTAITGAGANPGEAVIQLTATSAGTDTYIACDDTDRSRTCDPGEPRSAPTNVVWHTPAPGPQFVSVVQNPSVGTDPRLPGETVATIRLVDAAGTPVHDAHVLVVETGADFEVLARVTNGSGVATATFAASHSGDHSFYACVDQNTDGVCGSNDPTTSGPTVTWLAKVAPPQVHIQQNPTLGGTDAPGDSAIFVLLQDEDGRPVVGHHVIVTVNGANPASQTLVTSNPGAARFVFTAANPGLDLIIACDDENDDGYCEPSEPTSTPQTITWTARPTVPGIPTWTGATPGNRSATLSWSAPASDGSKPLTGFVITPYIGTVPQPPRTFTPWATSATITGLANGTTYSFTIAATNAIGTGTPSPLISVVVGAPTAPTSVTASAGDGTARVSWTPPTSTNGSPITGYLVTPFLNGAAQPSQRFGRGAASGTVTGLRNGSTYTFTVTAVNARGRGPASAPSAPVTVGTPSAPRRVAVLAGPASATVTWNGPTATGGSPITGYVITPYIAGVAQAPTLATATASAVVVAGLTNGGAYTFTVAAVNARGLGASSPPTAAIVIGTPSAPRAVTATPGSASATVSWYAPLTTGGFPITGYVITPFIGGVAQAPRLAPAGATSLVVTGLSPASRYAFTVAAVNAIGVGEASAETTSVRPR